jgi:hypothetical protein
MWPLSADACLAVYVGMERFLLSLPVFTRHIPMLTIIVLSRAPSLPYHSFFLIPIPFLHLVALPHPVREEHTLATPQKIQETLCRFDSIPIRIHKFERSGHWCVFVQTLTCGAASKFPVSWKRRCCQVSISINVRKKFSDILPWDTFMIFATTKQLSGPHSPSLSGCVVLSVSWPIVIAS